MSYQRSWKNGIWRTPFLHRRSCTRNSVLSRNSSRKFHIPDGHGKKDVVWCGSSIDQQRQYHMPNETVFSCSRQNVKHLPPKESVKEEQGKTEALKSLLELYFSVLCLSLENMAFLISRRRRSSRNRSEPKGLEKSSKKKKRRCCFSRTGCFKTSSGATDGSRAVELESNGDGDRRSPTHLVVFVNGLLGRPANSKYAAKQFVKRLPEDVIVYRSKRNTLLLTFDGVDVMGGRLAEEVMSVVKKRPELQKISFVSHSLGGLIARYAIAKLYAQDPFREHSKEAEDYRKVEDKSQYLEEKSEGKIAGLEPMNFIAVGTPHLGSRWHKQIPIFCGNRMLEKMAFHMSWIIGRSGTHIFLKDHEKGRPPLLLQMVNDCNDLQFMSALQSFKRRVIYSNTCFDYIVGWSSSSIRRKHELPKLEHVLKNDKYPHIVNVEAAKVDSVQQEFLLECEVQTTDLEEAMIRGLNKVSWERVDVSFDKSKQRYCAHCTIQVNVYFLHSDGADVIFHIIDNFLL